MKTKHFLLAVAVLLMGTLTSCHNEPEGPDAKINYLELAHSMVGKSNSEVQAALEKKGFSLNGQNTDGTQEYTLVNADSTKGIWLSFEEENGKVERFEAEVVLDGVINQEDAKKHLTNWHNYAFKSMFAPVSSWVAYVEDEETDNMYLEGSLVEQMKPLIMAAAMGGAIDQEDYKEIVKMLNNTQDKYLEFLQNSLFTGAEQGISEMFMHTDTDFSQLLGNLMGGTMDGSTLAGLSNMKATLGALEAWHEDGQYIVGFSYMGEQEMDLEDMLPFGAPKRLATRHFTH